MTARDDLADIAADTLVERSGLLSYRWLAEEATAAVLDALAAHPDLLAAWLQETGVLQRMSWMNEAGTWFCPAPTPTCRVPVFRVADRTDTP